MFLKNNIKKTVLILFLTKSLPYPISYFILESGKFSFILPKKTVVVQNVMLFTILDKHEFAYFI